ncbi:alpha-N-acetylglucosaminidase [Paenibacillus sp. N10]|uniref:Alpha-N-acetylglucosaminidase n=2 Tax=Paenibacillus lutrae TaxID=2078573 RepID=A0A7X3JXR0_9BACL|nr:alpha-N-acetylglucosaminidase [Paenibacillus lutrae]
MSGGERMRMDEAERAAQAVRALMIRTIGAELANSFTLKVIRTNQEAERFEIGTSDAGLIEIRGNTVSALAAGFHWYLKHVGGVHVSWCGSRIDLQKPLPAPESTISECSPYRFRYNLNYCTYSYSMAFWSWERWERELDWMALSGINLMLSLVGQESVWRNTLIRLGYTEAEAAAEICGPAFFAWQWMQNLTGWGGPLPGSWFEDREKLARRIHDRMRELGIEPVVPGYSGMVPAEYGKRIATGGSMPLDQGLWCGFRRPSLLLPESPAFGEIAKIFYEEQERLTGSRIRYFSMDPFHEGGSSEGVDLHSYAKGVELHMLKSNPAAVWVFQAWEGNPKRELLQAVDRKHALVLDLWCESKPAWKSTEAFHGVPWVWCMIQNYGGKNGLFGNLRTIAQAPIAALNDPAGGIMTGIGMAMEGTGTNPVMYDLLTDMMWRSESPDIGEWLEGYIQRRYGSASNEAMQAWLLLVASVYDAQTVQQGAAESLLCARPAPVIANVSTWGPKEPHYEASKVREACQLLLASRETCGTSDGYRYDLADVARQAAADYSRVVYAEIMEAYERGDQASFELAASRFLALLDAQEQLMRTRPEFLLGRWLEEARSLGRTEPERQLLEWNARTLVTVWGPRASAEVLHDYAHREWSGLLERFYRPRWVLYFASLRNALKNGCEPAAIDWFVWEAEWTLETDHYPVQPDGCVYEAAERVLRLIGV